MPKEIEIKFRVDDQIESALKRAGAKKLSQGLEHNEVFDNGKLRKNGFLLRLRKFSGKNTLTFKSKIEKGKFKEAEETDILVQDFSGMKNVLRSLGYEVFWVYEKRKSVYSLGKTIISIDTLPIGKYMEIEGTERGIMEVIQKLGLNITDGITETYFDLYEEFCRKKGKEMDNLVFWKRSR